MTIEEAKQYILEGGKITEEQALSLANHPDKEALYEAAHQITRHFMGNKFDTCSIINAKSGNCSEDCKWCAQSGHYKTLVNLYPLLPAKECVYHAVYNRKQGIRRFALVTSGKRVSDKELEQITNTIRQIKRQSDIKCCASMGLLTRSQLQSLYDSGVENYHCNIETAPSYFRQLCSTHTIEQELPTTDLVIGAVLIPGAKAPHLITRDMLKLLKPGSVLVDVAIDQGGCFETSHPTTHANPVYEIDDILHYCVANIPGAVPQTSTLALTNATLPYVIKLADRGWEKASKKIRA